MTNDAWAALSPRERDALVAERLGLPLEPPCGYYHRVDDAEYSDGRWSGWCYDCGSPIADVAPKPRHYTTDPAAARLVEDEIERRGLRETYAERVVEVIDPDGAEVYTSAIEIGIYTGAHRTGPLLVWALLRASPADRCLAALRVLEV
jgi:hypothetical protein